MNKKGEFVGECMCVIMEIPMTVRIFLSFCHCLSLHLFYLNYSKTNVV